MANSHKAGNYKAYNVLHKINYWKLRGEDPEFLFEGLDLDYRKLCENDWLDFLTQIKVIWDNELIKVPDPRDHEKLGYDVYRNQSMGAVEVVAKLFPLKYIFKKFVDFARQYSLVEYYEVDNLTKNSAIVIYSPKREFYSHFGFSSSNFVKGFLRAMPRIHEPLNATDHERVPDAEVNMVMNCFSLETVLNKDYKYLAKNHEIELIEDKLIFDKRILAKKILLATENGLYVNRETEELENLENELKKPGTGFVVLDDLCIDNSLILKKGEIYDAPYCRFDISWSRAPFLTRAKYVFRDAPRVLKSSRLKLLEQLEVADQRYFNEMRARERAEKAEAEVRKYADHLAEMVEERTKDLRETQVKLIESEKRTLEHRITGGFAHEMRNALAGAQLEFKTILNYKEQGFSATDAIKQATTHLFETIEQLHKKYDIPKEEIVQGAVPYLKEISSILSELSRTMEGVHHDLERGLSITNVIRDYAKMSEIKPGDTPVDLVPPLREFENRYRKDFERIGIRYSVEGVDKAIVWGEEIHIAAIFSNLILNARDALEEYETENQKTIKVEVGREDTDAGSHFRISVSDNGPGIPEDHLNEIFEPFFSTKPTSGTGLGLGIVKRLVHLYGGEIGVESRMNEGTILIVILPKGSDGE